MFELYIKTTSPKIQTYLTFLWEEKLPDYLLRTIFAQ